MKNFNIINKQIVNNITIIINPEPVKHGMDLQKIVNWVMIFIQISLMS